MYVYLAEKDDFSTMPENIYKGLGVIEFTMELELTADRKLARENPAKVIDNLKLNGFHIQLPDEVTVEELAARIAREKLS